MADGTDEPPRYSVDVVERLRVRCPCGGLVIVGDVKEEGTSGGGVPAAMHIVPACKRYIDMEPADFLKWIRETLQKMPTA